MQSLSKFIKVRVLLLIGIVLLVFFTVSAYVFEKKFELEISKTLEQIQSLKVKSLDILLSSDKGIEISESTNLLIQKFLLENKSCEISSTSESCNLLNANFRTNFLEKDTDYVDIAVFNATGTRIFLLNNSRSNFTPATLSPRPKNNLDNFIESKSSKNTFIGKNNTVPSDKMLIALEIYSKNAYVGSVTFIINQKAFKVLSQEYDTSTKTYGIDNTGSVISFSNNTKNEKIADSKTIDYCKKNINDTFILENGGVKTYVKVYFYKPLGICIVSEMDTNRSVAFGQFLYKTQYSFLALLLMVIYLLSSFFYKKIKKSLILINKISEEALLGKDLKDMPVTNILEIDALSKTLSYALHIVRKDEGFNLRQDIVDQKVISKEKGIAQEAVSKMKRFKEAVDAADDIIAILTLDGHVSYVNKIIQSINGNNPLAVEGKEPYAMWHKRENTNIFKEAFKKAIETKNSQEFFCEALKLNGSTYESQVKISPIINPDTGIVSSLLMLEQDVSDQKQKERVKNEFISVVSHELRTPMTVIRGYSALLSEGKMGELNSKQKEFIERINSETGRLLDLANDMLDLQKFDAGKAELHLEKVNVFDILKDQVAEFEPLFAKKGLYLKAEDHAENKCVMIDKRYFARAITNLINNAMKFTEKGGVDLFLVNPDAQHVVIAVKDTGIGIPAEAITHLFNKFYQASNVLDRKQEGSGLGLSIVKKITEAHKGVVWVESVEGTGSTFYIALPAA